MRQLLLAGLVLTACGPKEAAKSAGGGDTTAAPAASDTIATPTPPTEASGIDSALANRLVGTWNAEGVDSGSTRPQRFTITWSRAPDGAVTGKISFQRGESYNVKLVSARDSTLMYESDPHRSPTLQAEVVTRTEGVLSGETLSGKYEARASGGGKTLSGRFTAKRAPR